MQNDLLSSAMYITVHGPNPGGNLMLSEHESAKTVLTASFSQIITRHKCV